MDSKSISGTLLDLYTLSHGLWHTLLSLVNLTVQVSDDALALIK